MSEVFADAAYRTQSNKFIECIKKRLPKVPDKSYIESIQTDIEFAESII